MLLLLACVEPVCAEIPPDVVTVFVTVAMLLLSTLTTELLGEAKLLLEAE